MLSIFKLSLKYNKIIYYLNFPIYFNFFNLIKTSLNLNLMADEQQNNDF